MGEGRRGSALNQWEWRFHTAWGGIDPGDHRFRPRIDGATDV